MKKKGEVYVSCWRLDFLIFFFQKFQFKEEDYLLWVVYKGRETVDDTVCRAKFEIENDIGDIMDLA